MPRNKRKHRTKKDRTPQNREIPMQALLASQIQAEAKLHEVLTEIKRLNDHQAQLKSGGYQASKPTQDTIERLRKRAKTLIEESAALTARIEQRRAAEKAKTATATPTAKPKPVVATAAPTASSHAEHHGYQKQVASAPPPKPTPVVAAALSAAAAPATPKSPTAGLLDEVLERKTAASATAPAKDEAEGYIKLSAHSSKVNNLIQQLRDYTNVTFGSLYYLSRHHVTDVQAILVEYDSGKADSAMQEQITWLTEKLTELHPTEGGAVATILAECKRLNATADHANPEHSALATAS